MTMTMTRRQALGTATALAAASASATPDQRRQPNFIVILCDDLGMGDVEPYGSRIRTPGLARMAREGLVATSYYAPANVCTPSRAGLLTGRYPVRTGLGHNVILADDRRGLPLSEPTIAKALGPDYATALIGKWHLGHVEPYWPPTQHGFDTFFGIPYSHDIEPLVLYEASLSHALRAVPHTLETLQQQFSMAAEAFVERNRDRPFFLELALSAPHLPCHPSKLYRGRTQQGPFGDVVLEIDAIVGRLLDQLRRLHLADDTLVIFTSDNGPWFEGSAGGLRDRKGGAGYDGGYRVPFIAWQPGTVPAGQRTDALLCGIDLLPTFCAMAGKRLPANVTLDGCDIGPVLRTGGRSPSPRKELLLFNNEDVVAIRTPHWKLVDRSYYRGTLMRTGPRGYPQLYDVTQDPDESYSVAERHPDVMVELARRLEAARFEFAPFRRVPASG